MINPRIIGERSGSQRGPLLIVLAQIHGNEPAGTHALQQFFNAIDAECDEKLHFDFRGN
jgi:succinylglutamate desuccinylase